MQREDKQLFFYRARSASLLGDVCVTKFVYFCNRLKLKIPQNIVSSLCFNPFRVIIQSEVSTYFMTCVITIIFGFKLTNQNLRT